MPNCTAYKICVYKRSSFNLKLSVSLTIGSQLTVCQPERITSQTLSYRQYLLSEFPGDQKCVRPVDDSDLPRHDIVKPVFACDKEDPQFVAESTKPTTPRTQIEIKCDENLTVAVARQRAVTYADELQTFRTQEERACLHEYIRQQCYDFRPVPDVIHLVWYGEAELSFRHAIGFYSLFTIAKPCPAWFCCTGTPPRLVLTGTQSYPWPRI